MNAFSDESLSQEWVPKGLYPLVPSRSDREIGESGDPLISNRRNNYMEANTNIPSWMEDPSVQDIPREKLAFLSQLYQQGQGKTQKEMKSFLMPMMAQARQKGLTFTPKELQIAVAAIRKASTPEELRQIDQIMSKASEKK